MNNQRYDLRGVSASKEDVHNAIKNIDKGVFPNAFCKIIPDIFTIKNKITAFMGSFICQAVIIPANIS